MTAAELKKLAGEKKLLIGTGRALKELKRGNVKKIFMSSNCPKDVKSDIEHDAKMHNVEIDKLNITNEEVGVVVKKPFAVSIVSLLK